jgi:predicted nuclease of predicted toxin-antitoxin system
MKFLLDENIGKLVAEFLRKEGYDVKSAIEGFRGCSDEEIIKTAFKENRILITLDQDFGRMIYQSETPHRGVVLLKLKNESQKAIIKILEKVIKEFNGKLKDKFTIVTEEKLRMR